uniref:UDP-glycosyltransferase 1 n=1 Tax=Linum usitatissimum TaxID=4006 RepID=I2BH70_LINUS|nr:UDP-glycosyltransferase 1 [Linum usitatissimum]
MVPFPIQGHITPMLQLATILHSKGFPITIAHPVLNAPNPSDYHPDFKFVALQPDGVSDRSNHLFTLGVGGVVELLAANCPAPFKEALGKMMDEDGNKPCVIYDGLMYFAEGVGKEMGIPSLVLRTSCAANLLTYHVFPQLREKGHLPEQYSTSSEPVPGLPNLRYKDLPSYTTNWPIEAQLDFFATVRQTRSATAVIWNTSTTLESSSLSIIHQNHTVPQIPIFPVGPFHKQILQPKTETLTDEQTSALAFLDQQPPKSVLYISFGSVAVVTPAEFQEMAWGIANSGQRFFWVVRPGLVFGSATTDTLLPEGFSEKTGERGKVVKWAPQRKVLGHAAVGGFWTHCGWNSTLEAVADGVPMMCRPWFADQPVIARQVIDGWGVGVEMKKDMGKEEIEKVIRRLMVDADGEGIRKNALELKKKVLGSLAEGGSGFDGLNQLVEFIGSC